MDANCRLEETLSSINLSEYKINHNFELHTQCEICYNSQNCNLIDALKTNFRGISLSQMLDHFSSIKEYRLIEFSFTLCLLCVRQLISSYLFFEKLKKSNKKFKGLVKLGNKISEQYKNLEEKDNLGKTNNDESKDILKEYDSKYIITDGGENFVNSNDCQDEPQDSLFVKHEDITHDHSYIQNKDNNFFNDFSKEIKNKNELENIQTEEITNLQGKQFICHVCSAAFARKQSLDYHIRRIHLNEKTFLCSTCGKQFFLKVDYNRHILLHGGEGSHKCNLCKKGFVTSSLLKNHKKTVHKAKEIKCSHCSKMFKLGTQLKRHIMGAHNLLSTEKYGTVKAQEKAECNICSKKVNKYALKAHVDRHSGSKKYECNTCGQKFFQHIGLNNHMVRHQDPKFSCEYCGKSHFTKQEMLTHIRRQHTREIVCTCQHCGKGFVHQTNLMQHIKNCHTRENEAKFVEPKIPQQCTICGKIYSSRTSLIHHRRRTHENKEYSCTECDMTFRNLVPFKSHLKKIHNIGDTYSCDTCDKSYYTREDLYKHNKRTHQTGANSLYLCCTVCKIEKYKTKHELIQHIQGEHLTTVDCILYECNTCVTFFVNFEIFQKHLVKEHPSKTGGDVVILEYEIGGCKVQYFNNRRSIEQPAAAVTA